MRGVGSGEHPASLGRVEHGHDLGAEQSQQGAGASGRRPAAHLEEAKPAQWRHRAIVAAPPPCRTAGRGPMIAGMDDLKVGTRLHCGRCGTEVIVIKAPAATPTCCGEPLKGPEDAS